MFNIFLDDVRDVPTQWNSTHEKWIVVRRIDELQELLKAGKVNKLSLDHDLGLDQPTGYDLVCWMERENIWPKGIITIHSANPVGVKNIERGLIANGK